MEDLLREIFDFHLLPQMSPFSLMLFASTSRDLRTTVHEFVLRRRRKEYENVLSEPRHDGERIHQQVMRMNLVETGLRNALRGTLPEVLSSCVSSDDGVTRRSPEFVYAAARELTLSVFNFLPAMDFFAWWNWRPREAFAGLLANLKATGPDYTVTVPLVRALSHKNCLPSNTIMDMFIGYPGPHLEITDSISLVRQAWELLAGDATSISSFLLDRVRSSWSYSFGYLRLAILSGNVEKVKRVVTDLGLGRTPGRYDLNFWQEDIVVSAFQVSDEIAAFIAEKANWVRTLLVKLLLVDDARVWDRMLRYMAPSGLSNERTIIPAFTEYILWFHHTRDGGAKQQHFRRLLWLHAIGMVTPTSVETVFRPLMERYIGSPESEIAPRPDGPASMMRQLVSWLIAPPFSIAMDELRSPSDRVRR